jgi:hypothetical protein
MPLIFGRTTLLIQFKGVLASFFGGRPGTIPSYRTARDDIQALKLRLREPIAPRLTVP